MYNLPQYKEQDQKVVLDFIHQHPFAFLAACDEENKPVATQVPVFIEEREGKLYLSGHIMRNTDHHRALEKNPHVLCVFTGPHTYVSATWYKDPNVASTWNYMSVHVKGTLTFLGLEELIEVLKKTSLHFENNNPHSTTVFENLPEEYTTRLMKGIVAFEIEVQKIDNVFKLSQNRDEESFHNIIKKLDESGHDGKFIAEEMKKRTSQVFDQKKNQ